MIENSPSALSGALMAGVGSEAVSVAAAVLCIRVVKGMQERLDARRAEVADV